MQYIRLDPATAEELATFVIGSLKGHEFDDVREVVIVAGYDIREPLTEVEVRIVVSRTINQEEG